jgi:hypothetical protein
VRPPHRQPQGWQQGPCNAGSSTQRTSNPAKGPVEKNRPLTPKHVLPSRLSPQAAAMLAGLLLQVLMTAHAAHARRRQTPLLLQPSKERLHGVGAAWYPLRARTVHSPCCRELEGSPCPSPFTAMQEDKPFAHPHTWRCLHAPQPLPHIASLAAPGYSLPPGQRLNRQ